MLRIRSAALAALGLSLVFVQGTKGAIVTTFEAAGVQTSTVANTSVIDFDSLGHNWHSSESYNPTSSLTASYQGDFFGRAADQYGGAGGTGSYFSVQATASVTLTLSESQSYFGLWFSAADPSNKIEFYNGSTLLATFTGTGTEMSSLSGDYLGNPNANFSGSNGLENYVFVNFFAQTAGDQFNKIVFTNLAGATEFESDNHTFLKPNSVPEPSTIVSSGLGAVMLMGSWLRKRRSRVSKL